MMATPMPAAAAPVSWLPLGSLIFGIMSVIFFWIPIVGFVLGITGIVLSVMALRMERNPLATAGLVVSIIGAALGALTVIGGIIAIAQR
jgi:hypothetical protein